MQMTSKDSRAKFPNSSNISIENCRRCTLRNHQNHSAGKFRFRMKENFRCWISEYYTEMAVEASLGSSVASPSAENVKSTGKSAAGSQVSNSGDGVYCHQCRQKTRAPTAACKNLTKKKPCSVKICRRCLWNRYGEDLEEVASLEEWKCPKCRLACNCSVCLKRRGLQPMGILTSAAKATGFSPVTEMLTVEGSDHGKDVLSARKKGKESLDVDDNTPSKRMKHSKLAETSHTIREEIVLPVETSQTFKLG